MTHHLNVDKGPDGSIEGWCDCHCWDIKIRPKWWGAGAKGNPYQEITGLYREHVRDTTRNQQLENTP